MYRVYLDDELLYHPNLVKQKNLSIENTRLNVELNKTGSFTFTIRKNNPRYAQLKKMQSIVKVYDDSERLFRGRILNSKRGLYNELQVTCEGELAFLLDSKVRPYEFTGSVEEYHRFLVEQHNGQVNTVKQFKVGRCTVTDPNDYITRASSDYPSTWDEFNDKLISILGGYIWTREEDDGIYIDYLADFDGVNNQSIEFGENLLDFEETIKGQDIATAIIPLGANIVVEEIIVDEEGNETIELVETDERLTIADINNGADYVYHEEAVKKYGLIFKTVVYEDVTLAENLKKNAEEELQNTIYLVRTLDLKAVDLHTLKLNIKSFKLGRYTHVKSDPHEIDEYLLTRKLSINILNVADSTLLLGDEKKTFTDKHVEEKKTTNLYIGQVIEESKTAIKDVVKVIDKRVYSQIDHASEKILLRVAEEYYTEEEIDDIVLGLNTIIEATAEGIELRASSTYATKENINAVQEHLVNNYMTRVETEAAITIESNLIKATVKEDINGLSTRMSSVEQTATDLTVRLTGAESNISSAQSTANTAKNIANAAQVTATNAEKTATNYLNFSSSGLIVGDMTASVLGKNVLIDTNSLNIRDNATTLASFQADKIQLGKNSVSSVIELCGAKGQIRYNGDSEYVELTSDNVRVRGIESASLYAYDEVSAGLNTKAAVNVYSEGTIFAYVTLGSDIDPNEEVSFNYDTSTLKMTMDEINLMSSDVVITGVGGISLLSNASPITLKTAGEAGSNGDTSVTLNGSDILLKAYVGAGNASGTGYCAGSVLIDPRGVTLEGDVSVSKDINIAGTKVKETLSNKADKTIQAVTVSGVTESTYSTFVTTNTRAIPSLCLVILNEQVKLTLISAVTAGTTINLGTISSYKPGANVAVTIWQNSTQARRYMGVLTNKGTIEMKSNMDMPAGTYYIYITATYIW